ncbi:hypothetical protein G4V62_02895 [Bacillaceae bacterium SIJ1]|uniref:hypothetical protein n=1 Tax=Litoribacterium kuwaitense TaxID=1398745 RepID=UPI0013E9B461|nr:hypothetical protein [Litoribacterium kuwaitense]NGP43946.1 hypothetical protein [Litoribacterium kuwaitense]
MIYDEVPKQDIQQAMTDWLDSIHASIERDARQAKKGLSLFRQGSVYNVVFSEGQLSGSVQDVRKLDTRVTLTQPDVHECTCGLPYCGHVLALLLYVLSHFESPGERLANWEQDRSAPKANVTLRKQQPLTIEDIQSLDEALRPMNWQFDPFLRPNALQRNYARLVEAYKGPWQLRRLYALVAGLYMLKQWDDISHEGDAAPLMNEMKELALACHELNVKDDAKPHLQELCAKAFHPYLSLAISYIDIFSVFISLDRWLQSEALNRPLLNPSPEDIRTHYFLETPNPLDQKTEAMLEMIHKYQSLEQRDAEMQKWVESCRDWLQETWDAWKDESLRNTRLRQLLEEQKHYAEKKNALEAFGNILIKWLPESLTVFSALLLEQGKDEECIELWLFQAVDLEQIAENHLQTIAERSPNALLPLYHQLVERYVAKKNKSGYKKAAETLERLRDLYVRLDKQAVWEAYFTNFLDRYERLRALRRQVDDLLTTGQ